MWVKMRQLSDKKFIVTSDLKITSERNWLLNLLLWPGLSPILGFSLKSFFSFNSHFYIKMSLLYTLLLKSLSASRPKNSVWPVTGLSFPQPLLQFHPCIFFSDKNRLFSKNKTRQNKQTNKQTKNSENYNRLKEWFNWAVEAYRNCLIVDSKIFHR